MKISFHITAGAVGLDVVQQQTVNCSQSARCPRGDGVHHEQSAHSSINTAGGAWVRSLDELMTPGGLVFESWHLKWRTGFVITTNKLEMRISHCPSSVFPPVVQEVCCADFQPGGSGEERQKTQTVWLRILLSLWQGIKWVNRRPSVTLWAFLFPNWSGR